MFKFIISSEKIEKNNQIFVRNSRVLVVFYLVLTTISAQPERANQPIATEKSKITKLGDESTIKGADPTEDEISLVIKGKIIAVTDKEIIYKETGSTLEGRAPLHNLHFIRKTSGEYRFFTPARTDLKNPTQISIQEMKSKEITGLELLTKAELFVSAGGGDTFGK